MGVPVRDGAAGFRGDGAGRCMGFLDLKLRLGRITQAYTRCLDGLVRYFVELVVAGMPLSFVRGVVCSVVAKKYRPASIGRAVLVGAVHHIAVEEQAVARRHLGIDEVHLFEHLIHALHVGAYLLARSSAVVDAASMMRAANDLQAAVVAVCAV